MSDKVATVYSKDGCGFCVKAKHVLISHDYVIEEKKIGTDVSKEEMITAIGRTVNTVPQVMIDGKYVGGYQEVCKFLGE